MSTIMFIDPGTRRLGWSRFVDDGVSVWLKDSGVEIIKGRGSGFEWTARVNTMVWLVSRVMQPSRRSTGSGVDRRVVSMVVIELPRHWSGGSVRGEGAKNSGSILKLMFLIGALRQMLLERGIAVELVDVGVWKGNVPKAITARRVSRWWGLELVDDERLEGSDRCDAVGIGDYWFRKRRGRPIRKLVKRGI